MGAEKSPRLSTRGEWGEDEHGGEMDDDASPLGVFRGNGRKAGVWTTCKL